MATIICNGNRGLLGSYKATMPSVGGFPVPDNDNALEWWYSQAEEDIDKVLVILSMIEKHGKAWVHDLVDKIAKNCLV